MDIYAIETSSGETILLELAFDEDLGYWRFCDLSKDNIRWRPYYKKEDAIDQLEHRKKTGIIKNYYKMENK